MIHRCDEREVGSPLIVRGVSILVLVVGVPGCVDRDGGGVAVLPDVTRGAVEYGDDNDDVVVVERGGSNGSDGTAGRGGEGRVTLSKEDGTVEVSSSSSSSSFSQEVEEADDADDEEEEVKPSGGGVRPLPCRFFGRLLFPWRWG
jgi:hypothetical protein